MQRRFYISQFWLQLNDDQYYNQFSDLEEVAAEAGLGCHIFNIFDDGNTKR